MKFSIRQRISITIGALGLLLLVFFALFSLFFDRYERLNQAQQNVKGFAFDFLQLKVYESNFFQNDIKNASFFFDEYSQSIVAFNEKFEEVIDVLEATSLAYGDFNGRSRLIGNLVSDLNQYQEAFIDITSRLRELGNREYGLINKLITVEQDLDRIANLQLRIPLVAERLKLLRGYHDDFLITGDLLILDKFEHKYNEFGVVVNAFPNTFFGGEDQKKKFQIKLREYSKWFSLIVEKKSVIGREGQTGLYLNLMYRFEKLNEDTSKLSSNWLADIDKGRNALKIIAFVMVFIVFMIAIFAVILTLNSFYKPLATIQDQALLLSKGEIPTALERVSLSDINKLVASMNVFVQGIRDKVDFSKSIGEGNLDVELVLLSEKDELGVSLLEMRNKLLVANEENIKNKQEEELRQWFNTGESLVGNVLRLYSGNLNDLSRNVIKTMVKYLDALQSGFYSLEDRDGEQELVLIASYAFDREKFQTKKIPLGEGLIGTVAVEKETLFLKNIPKGYLELGATFGVFEPVNLVIVPLVLDNEVHGVIEIASLHSFQSFQLDFIESIARDIASSLASVKINDKTLRLLEDSRMQSDSLKNKELLIAKKIEELETSRLHLQNQELEAKALLKSVDQGLLRIEIDIQSRVIEINTKVESLLNVLLTEMKGHPISSFLPTISVNVFNSKWDQLINNMEAFELETLLKTSKGQSWVMVYFFPVTGRDGLMTCIQMIGFDILEFKNREAEFQNEHDKYISRHTETEVNILALRKRVSKAETEVVNKDIELQALFLDTKKMTDDYTMLQATHEKLLHQNHLKDKRINNIKYRLDLILNSVVVGIVIVSKQGYITFANQKILDLLHVDFKSLVNQRFSDAMFAFDPFAIKLNQAHDASMSLNNSKYLDVRVTVHIIEDEAGEQRILFLEDMSVFKQKYKEFIEDKEAKNQEITKLHGKISKLNEEIRSLKNK